MEVTGNLTQVSGKISTLLGGRVKILPDSFKNLYLKNLPSKKSEIYRDYAPKISLFKYIFFRIF
jgi:hypothetical protein